MPSSFCSLTPALSLCPHSLACLLPCSLISLNISLSSSFSCLPPFLQPCSSQCLSVLIVSLVLGPTALFLLVSLCPHSLASFVPWYFFGLHASKWFSRNTVGKSFCSSRRSAERAGDLGLHQKLIKWLRSCRHFSASAAPAKGEGGRAR